MYIQGVHTPGVPTITRFTVGLALSPGGLYAPHNPLRTVTFLPEREERGRLKKVIDRFDRKGSLKALRDGAPRGAPTRFTVGQC